jgi:hypothetical protein
MGHRSSSECRGRAFSDSIRSANMSHGHDYWNTLLRRSSAPIDGPLWPRKTSGAAVRLPERRSFTRRGGDPGYGPSRCGVQHQSRFVATRSRLSAGFSSTFRLQSALGGVIFGGWRSSRPGVPWSAPSLRGVQRSRGGSPRANGRRCWVSSRRHGQRIGVTALTPRAW